MLLDKKKDKYWLCRQTAVENYSICIGWAINKCYVNKIKISSHYSTADDNALHLRPHFAFNRELFAKKRDNNCSFYRPKIYAIY